jgi:hypothetical protein
MELPLPPLSQGADLEQEILHIEDLAHDARTRTTILARLACANDPDTVMIGNDEVAAQSQNRLRSDGRLRL